MSERKRKFTEDESEYQQPTKKCKTNTGAAVASYSSSQIDERMLPQNEYDGPHTRYPSQLNELSPSPESSSPSENDDQDNINSNKPTKHSPKPSPYIRKPVPQLHSSQESLLPTIPKPKRNIIRAWPRVVYHTIPGKRTAQASTTKTDANNTDSNFNCFVFASELRRSFSDKGWLFVLIGVVVGYLMCSSALWIMNGYTQTNHTDCLCNVSTIECKDCLDKYLVLNREHAACNKQNKEWKTNDECDRIKDELDDYNIRNSEVREHVCSEYLDTINVLKHELGECTVEWGSCEQVGRQKDALDIQRLKEIKKQKQKFSFCKDQLKIYKDKAKKDRQV
eukprot:25119_1